MCTWCAHEYADGAHCMRIDAPQMMRNLSDKKARSAFKEAGAARDRDSFFQAWQSYVREWDLHHYTRYGASNYREGHIYGADHMTREGSKHGAGVQDSS